MSDTQFGKRDRAGHWKPAPLDEVKMAAHMKLIGSYDLVRSGFGGLK